jgi:hypothetical protein
MIHQKMRHFLVLTIQAHDTTANKGAQDYKRLRVLAIWLRAEIERPSDFLWPFRALSVFNDIEFGKMVGDFKPAYRFEDYTGRLL